jgi:predicted dehydrogenase
MRESEQIAVGVVGMGGMGGLHAGILQAEVAKLEVPSLYRRRVEVAR